MQDGRVEFTASGAQLLGFYLLQVLLLACTAGLWVVLLPRTVKAYKLRHTRIEGIPLRYQGGVGTALAFGVLKPLFVAATVGLVTPWLLVRGKRYEREHTLLADGRRLTFTGTTGQASVLVLLSLVLFPLTCGLAFPWLYARWKQWEWRHTRLSYVPVAHALMGPKASELAGQRGWRPFTFAGHGGALFGPYLLNLLLVALTCGLYTPWACAKLFRWEAGHTHAAA